MRLLHITLLAACLAVAGCRTNKAEPDAGEEASLREMRTEVVRQLRAAGASPAQIREVERQLELAERQVRQAEKQMKRLEEAAE